MNPWRFYCEMTCNRRILRRNSIAVHRATDDDDDDDDDGVASRRVFVFRKCSTTDGEFVNNLSSMSRRGINIESYREDDAPPNIFIRNSNIYTR